MSAFSIHRIREIALHAVLDQIRVQEFFDRIYAVTGLPMICFDTSFQHIAHAFELPFYLQSWVEISVNSRANPEEIERYDYLSYQETTASAGKSIYVIPKRDAAHPCVNCAVVYQGELLAYCGTVVEDCDPDLALELNDIVSSTIPFLLIPEILKKNDLGLLILKDSLSRDEAEQVSSTFRSPYFFAVLSPVRRGLSTMQYVRSYIEKHFENTVSAVTGGGDVYMLFSDAASDEIVLTVQKNLDQLGKKYSFQIALSCSFFDAAEIPMRRRQALLALNTGRRYYPDSHMYFLRFLYPEIIAHYGGTSEAPELILTPELKKLYVAAPDKAEEYFLDLFYYLINSENYALAAKKRGIHKNTLIYRISQIQDLCGMELSTGPESTRQLLSVYFWLLNNNLIPEDYHDQSGTNE